LDVKVNVRLFGALETSIPGYKPSTGLEVEMREGATVKELLFLLNLLRHAGLAIVRDGRILKADEEIHPGDGLCLIQAVHGG